MYIKIVKLILVFLLKYKHSHITKKNNKETMILIESLIEFFNKTNRNDRTLFYILGQVYRISNIRTNVHYFRVDNSIKNKTNIFGNEFFFFGFITSMNHTASNYIFVLDYGTHTSIAEGEIAVER